MACNTSLFTFSWWSYSIKLYAIVLHCTGLVIHCTATLWLIWFHVKVKYTCYCLPILVHVKVYLHLMQASDTLKFSSQATLYNIAVRVFVFDSYLLSFSKVLFMIKVGCPTLLIIIKSGSLNRTLPAGSLCCLSGTFLLEF